MTELIVKKIRPEQLPKGAYRGYPAALMTLEQAVEKFRKQTGKKAKLVYEVTCHCNNIVTYYIVLENEYDETL